MGRDHRPKVGDPRGHSARIYDEIYDSDAFRALSPHDVLAYLALLRDLRATNNGDLSLPLSKAKHRGIKHKTTLARSLRALRAVGLIALTSTGGRDKDGHRLPNLYRVTDVQSYAFPKKFIEARPATNEWKRVTSIAQARALIAQAEAEAKADAKAQPDAEALVEKTKAQGHAMTRTGSRGDQKLPQPGVRREPWVDALGHAVNLCEAAENRVMARVPGRFVDACEERIHSSPGSPPFALLPSHADFVPVEEDA
ncbi:hypothetical protein [Variovorax sp. WDL1]|nr:hypothetical protein [Variovorax sp. WDL1]